MSEAAPTALIFDADAQSAARIAQALGGAFAPVHAATGADAFTALREDWVQIFLVDAAALADAGEGLLSGVRRRWPDVVQILLSADDAPPAAEDDACVDLRVAKPCRADALRTVARNGARLYALQREKARLAVEMTLVAPDREGAPAPATPPQWGGGFDALVRAEGSPLDALCRTAARIAGYDIPALILGETGAGKELMARAIHDGSPRAERPFFALNCAAIPDELLESELFGHRKGAFTGAHQNHVGLFEKATGGTIFLDEIGDISPAFQVKMLRFLQEGEIRPVGANETRHVDVRIIAATHHDIEEDVRRGVFREDLYYRLAVAPILIPPLRERPEDVEALALALLDRAMARFGKPVRGFTPEAMACLTAYSWPGNIRELENEVVRMLIMADGEDLPAALIAPHILQRLRDEGPDDPTADALIGESGTLKERVERMEARILRETLIRRRWNKSRAAEELGLSRVGLRAKLERYGLDGGKAGDGDDKIVSLEAV